LLEQEPFRFLGENLDHRLRVFDHGLQFFAQHAAVRVDLLDRQQLSVV
jgi:hypothetical protein